MLVSPISLCDFDANKKKSESGERILLGRFKLTETVATSDKHFFSDLRSGEITR